ncbi:MAG: flap endonuclease-1 [Candidatus Hodarchaeales archaeon]
MGTQIGKLISNCRHEISLESLSNKVIGFDAYNMIYAFLAPIRHESTWGGYLKDSKGNVTSHLSGLFYRLTNWLPYRLKPVFIFDGKPPKFKEEEIMIRKQRKKVAEKKRQKAIERGDLVEAMKYAQATSRITLDMVEDAKQLLGFFGIPCVQAKEEAEAQGAFMVRQGQMYAMASQDYDSFLFGCNIVIRNLTVTRRRHGHDSSSIELLPEEILLNDLLEELGFSDREQLIMLSLLIGTDYNPGVKGVGPKTALKIVRKFKTPDEIVNHIKLQYGSEKYSEAFPFSPNILKEYFLNPEVNTKHTISFSKPDLSKIKEFMIEEREFNKARIERQLNSMMKRRRKFKQTQDQTSLEGFFS